MTRGRVRHHLLLCIVLCQLAPEAARAAPVPQSVEELWASFDPRRDPLEAEVADHWTEGNGEYRVVVYTIGTFKGVKARMAAYYGAPKGRSRVPGLLHMHGGGQRAFLDVVRYYVGRGYACLSVNWGGRPLDDAHPDWPNTQWGAVDPTQNNVPGYASLAPSAKSLERMPSPRNNNWYLLTLGCRRGLTFLERQPEVDGSHLGIFGHSMGGNLTVYVAATDRRVKAAVPSVGGAGFRTHDVPGIPGTARRIDRNDAATALHRRTIAAEAYAPHIQCPILFLGATNDFNSRMESVYRCFAHIPHDRVRFTFSPHLNHRFLPPQEVCRPLWLDACLKGTDTLPATPAAELLLAQPDGVPRFRVRPDPSRPIAGVDIYYAVDADALARFCRSAVVAKDGAAWTAPCPVLSLRQPLVAFANVHYELTPPEVLSRHRTVTTFCLSSLLRTATPEQLRAAGVRATDRPSLLIDDFQHGWRDWYRLSPDNPHHWQFWTRKITDPKWRGPAGARLAVEVGCTRANMLLVLAWENEWRGYRGRRKLYVAQVRLSAAQAWQDVVLQAADFRSTDDDTPLARWDQLDQLGFRAYADIQRGGKTLRLGGLWAGSPPKLRHLRWVKK